MKNGKSETKDGFIRQLVMMGPALCQVDETIAKKIVEDLEQKWSDELKGLKFQRVQGQSVYDRLKPGFEWMNGLQDPTAQKVAECIRLVVEKAALCIDRNNKVPDVDLRRLDKLNQRIAELRPTEAGRVVFAVVDPDTVETLDFWN